jgi:superfamily II DNA or RNA helicase
MDIFKDTGKLCRTRIESIEEVDSTEEWVYDIEVEDNHNYFANRVLVSNSSNETVRGFFQTHLQNIYYRYGLTATNFKNDENAAIFLECVLSNVLYTVPVQDAINKGYITPVAAMFFNMKNNNLTSFGDYRQDVGTFIDNNAERNAIIIETANKMFRKNIPTLVLVDHVQHGRELQMNLPEFVFLNGQDESSQYNMEMIKKFNDGKIPGLIGTSVLGEGVDTKAAGACIDASGGKARSEIMQKVGRVVRKFPNKKVGYYFNFMDYGAKHLISHSRERLKIIEETYGQKVQLIDV